MNRIIYYSYIQLCDMCTDQFERKSNIRVPVLLPYLFFIPICLHSHPKAALALPQWQDDHICLDAHLLWYVEHSASCPTISVFSTEESSQKLYNSRGSPC